MCLNLVVYVPLSELRKAAIFVGGHSWTFINGSQVGMTTGEKAVLRPIIFTIIL